MERRDFFKGAVYASLLNTLPLPRALAESSTDHPHIIHVVPDGANISVALQLALQAAYDLWSADHLKRRPVIELPAGEYVVDTIANNNRGNYPFRLPPCFKLMGQGKGQTTIRCAQPHGAQYRFLMTRPQSRIDVIEACPSLSNLCVDEVVAYEGPLFDSEISGLTLIDFDNAISLVDTLNVSVNNCHFIGSLVAVQLIRGSQYGNKNASFTNCDFDAQRTNGEKINFCLRFETPFYANWFKQVSNVLSKEECLNLGVGAVNYDPHTLDCEVTDDQKVIDYIDEFFGQNYTEDTTNGGCTISECIFTNARYSAIEFAGTLNTFNTVQNSTFYNCCGTAIEFDKGASYNTAYNNVISGMRPTTVFAPSVDYIFQASIQEQEGSYTANRQLKEVIAAYGLDDPNSSNFKGVDIFERAALLPVGNQILENQFDVSRNYWLSEYESNASKRAILPDIYPSIKISKPNKTKVIGNREFIGSPANVNVDASVVGQSILIYPNDTLRENIGEIEITANTMHGGFYIISGNDEVNFHSHCLVSDNQFGSPTDPRRAGLVVNGCIARSLEFKNNTFYCSENPTAISLKKLSIETLRFDSNQFYLQSENSFYLRNLNSDSTSSRTLNFTNNLINGGVAVNFYDWTSSNLASTDTLNFSHNHIKNVTGSSKVVGVTLWYKYINISDNHFDNLEDKVFQFYGLSDSLIYSPKNALTLGENSQSRAYGRNYANTAGSYVTNTFWGS